MTIWVSNTFDDMELEDIDTDTSGELNTRQLAARPMKWRKALAHFASWHTNCQDVTYVGLTNPSAPYTGGVLEMMRFTDRPRGGWYIPQSGRDGIEARDWSDLIGGSNSGVNAVFKVNPLEKTQRSGEIYALDVRRILIHVHDRYRRKYGQSWRVSAKGKMMCRDPGIHSWRFDWELLWTRQDPFYT